MKVIIALIFSWLTITGFAQNQIGVEATKMSTSKGEKEGFRMFIPDKTEKEVASSWINFTKEFKTKTKYDKNSNEYFSDDATILKLSENSIDIYTTIINNNGGILFSTAFDLGGIFISASKTPDKYLITQDILRKFYGKMAIESVNLEISTATSTLTTLEKDGSSLDANLESAQEELNNYQKEIKTLEIQAEAAQKEIAAQEATIAETQASVESLKREIEALNVPALELELKNVIDEGKKATLERSKNEKNIEKNTAEIEALKIEIESLKLAVAELSEKIAESKQNQNELEVKLKNIDIDKKKAELDALAATIKEAEQLKAAKAKLADAHLLEIKKLRVNAESTEKELEATMESKQLLSTKIKTQKESIQQLEELKSSFE